MFLNGPQFLFRNGDGGNPDNGFFQDEKDPQTSDEEMVALSETELDYTSKPGFSSQTGGNDFSPSGTQFKPHNNNSVSDLVSGDSDLEDLRSPTAAGNDFDFDDLVLESSSSSGEVSEMSYDLELCGIASDVPVNLEPNVYSIESPLSLAYFDLEAQLDWRKGPPVGHAVGGSDQTRQHNADACFLYDPPCSLAEISIRDNPLYCTSTPPIISENVGHYIEWSQYASDPALLEKHVNDQAQRRELQPDMTIDVDALSVRSSLSGGDRSDGDIDDFLLDAMECEPSELSFELEQ